MNKQCQLFHTHPAYSTDLQNLTCTQQSGITVLQHSRAHQSPWHVNINILNKTWPRFF